MTYRPTLVLKFGGSVLSDPDALRACVHEVYRHHRAGVRVVCVLSALSGATDALESRARALAPAPRGAEAFAYAALVGSGELTAAAEFVLALHRSGLAAELVEPHEAGLVAEGDPLDGRPVRLDRAALERRLDAGAPVILPGFAARDERGRPVLLGRGGSDLTAIFVAARLGARVRLVKDVGAVLEHDPRRPGVAPRRFATLHWTDALALGGRILQEKGLRLARAAGVELEVGGLARGHVTRVGDFETVRCDDDRPTRPLRVALAGLGSVGRGVFEELAARPDQFELVGVLVRDASLERTDRPVAARRLLTEDFEELLGRGPEVFVELAGGPDEPAAWIERALQSGADVVTANKAALAVRGPALPALAEARGRRLLDAAAVGGSLPALETARRLGGLGLLGFEGVLNGTTNWILDRLEEGLDLDRAVAGARAAGFAEADPSGDLEGHDAAHKVTLLARAAFGAEPRWLGTTSPAARLEQAARRARGAGRVLRQVAECHLSEVGPVASVALRALPPDHPLASVRDEENGLRFTLEDGEEITLRGRGAGRWPTTVSVLADLLELARTRRAPLECVVGAAGGAA